MNTHTVTDNKILMARARESLKGRWGTAVGVFLLYLALLVAGQFLPVIQWIFPILIVPPLVIGINLFSLKIAKSEEAGVETLLGGFNRYGESLGLYWLKMLLVLLWTLLLIVPGIMATFSYSMAYFILAEDPSAGPLDALRRSKEMMRGNRWKLFCLCLRFIGWFLLCLLTVGIGFLWLIPYIYTSSAHFYLSLKQGQPAAYADPVL